MRNPETLTLPELLNVDVVGEVEKATGLRVTSEPNLAGMLALSLSADVGRMKRKLLAEIGDTFRGMQADDYRSIVESWGFELVLETPFKGHHVDERHFVYAHRDGLLLAFDTYQGERVNGGNVYYTWRSDPDVKNRHELTSSGRYLDAPAYTLWQGDHDCREAIVSKLDALKDAGEFVTPWPEPSFLWLLHYMDRGSQDYDREAINEARIALLPDWVRQMTRPEGQAGEAAA